MVSLMRAPGAFVSCHSVWSCSSWQQLYIQPHRSYPEVSNTPAVGTPTKTHRILPRRAWSCPYICYCPIGVFWLSTRNAHQRLEGPACAAREVSHTSAQILLFEDVCDGKDAIDSNRKQACQSAMAAALGGSWIYKKSALRTYRYGHVPPCWYWKSDKYQNGASS